MVRFHRLGLCLLAVFAWLAVGCGALPGGTAGKTQGPIKVTIGVGGQSGIVYLPTTLAQQLGYYQEEGVDVTLQDLDAGSKALEAMLGGSTQVTSGFFDHTVQMAAQGKSIKSFVTMLRYPGLVLLVTPATQKKITRIEDLKGATVGVSAPGSSTHFFVNYLLTKHGMKADDISVTGVGSGASAVAAAEKGQVDAVSNVDPGITTIVKRNPNVTILADTRTTEGVKQAFGTDIYPAAVLYATSDWLDKNPDTARRLARAIVRSLQWMQQHKPEEIADKMPTNFRGNDPSIYIDAIRNDMQMFSTDGLMTPEGANAVKEVIGVSQPQVKSANIDSSKLYTNQFVQGK